MLTWLLIVSVVLVLLVASVRLLEPGLAFFPMAGESDTPRDFGAEFESLTIETRDGERLHAWSIKGRDARARVLYFHGNGGNLSVWAPILVGVARRGYDVLAVDYRGYGLSTGRPTEQGLYRDVEAIVERFWRDAPASGPTVYWGRSLGVSMAAYAATIRSPDGLILESGFPDVRSLIRGSPLALLAPFSTYRFPATEFLARLKTPTPVLVMHGDNDGVIPFAQGRALFDGTTLPKQFFTIRAGDHNDATPREPDAYWGAVDGFILRLKK
jgi:fermentation-respiration switch protein FrsA (DUF1100 family)